ncbi:hypothetical protein BJX61DRAFT_551504 [Aspergillus egyptiacus]|nr:hypothetical protein BJX61DRAFT_551504 [Aspergillus egyptiacus]
MQQTDSPSKPSSVACLPCRRRHLKCDALMPVCSRCRAANTECQYVRSKRGLRKHTRETSSQPLEESLLLPPDDFLDWRDATALDFDVPHTLSTQALFQPDGEAEPDFCLVPDDNLTGLPEGPVGPEVAYDPMIQLFYENFHPSHPFVIPRKALHSSLCYLIPPYLLSVMRYIGAHFYPNPSLQQALRQPAYGFLSDSAARDGFRVQALLLLAIVDHFHGHEQSSHRLLQMAVDLALQIGLTDAAFAATHSFGHPVVEESWRRTYWELYVVDGLLAAMGEQSSFQLYHHPAEVQLPCAEKLYNADNVIPTGQTLEDLQSAWTHDQLCSFSTFAHRINAVRKLGAVLQLNRSLESHGDSRTETAEAHITSSLIALPPLHPVSHDSSFHDEMVFQAQMILYLSLIHLHHPRSNLRFAPSPSTSCTRLKGSTDRSESNPESSTLDLPSHKLLRAADHLSGLATLPSDIHRRSPFFICALGMCVIVHTAALLVLARSGADTHPAGREESLNARIQLGIGALRTLGRVWPFAGVVRGRVVGVYQGVVLGRRPPSLVTS